MSIRQLLRLMRNGVSLGDGQVRLTHYRPVMPIGYRKKYFRGSFKFSIVTYLKKKYHTSKNMKFKNSCIFFKLKIAYFKGQIPSNFSYDNYHSKYFEHRSTHSQSWGETQAVNNLSQNNESEKIFSSRSSNKIHITWTNLPVSRTAYWW